MSKVKDKISNLKEKLNDILEDEDVEIAFCLFTIKGESESILVEKGHFYDITKNVGEVMREHHSKIREEIAI